MKGANRSANRATFQLDQMEARLRDLLEKTDTPALSGMILELLHSDHLAENRNELEVSKALWAVVSASAMITMGREITRRATHAES